MFDGPGLLDVPLGKSRTVLIKAPCCRDKQIRVPGINEPMMFSLDKISGPKPVPGAGSGSGSGSAHVVIPPPPPPPKLDCTNKILDPTPNGPCIKQFCAAHKDNDKCQIE